MPDIDRQWEPGTAEDLIADAAVLGEDFTPRTVTDWVEAGLLAGPAFHKSTQRGSDPRVYSADQRRLFTELLRMRGRSPHKRIRQDRLIEPVLYLWFEDNTIVTDQQARRALRTYAHGIGHLPAPARAAAARKIVGQIAHPNARPAERRAAEQMLVRVEKTAYETGEMDLAGWEKLYSILLDLSHHVDVRLAGLERGLGPAVAPFGIAELTASWMATLRTKVLLSAEKIPEETLTQARAEHIRDWARYQNLVRPTLHERSTDVHMFAAPEDAEDAARQSLRGYVTVLAGVAGLLGEAMEEAMATDARIRAAKRARAAT